MFIFSSCLHAGSRAAMRVMGRQQPRGGKVFLVDGQGSDGRATPKNAAYGATKAALVQLKVAEKVPVCCAVLCCSATTCRLWRLDCSPCCNCRQQQYTHTCVGNWLLRPDNEVRIADCARTAGVTRGASARQQHLRAPGVPRHGGDRPAGRERQVSWLPESIHACSRCYVRCGLNNVMQSRVDCCHGHTSNSQHVVLM